MNKRFFSILAIVAILLSVANLSLLLRGRAGAALLPSASVPQQISYQGRLTDVNGNPLNPLNGDVDIRFCLYETSTGGSALWCETYATANDTGFFLTNGVFSVQLGSITPIQDSVFDTEELYLGVKVGSDDEMTPRRRITSVGYAYRAADADTVDGMHASDFASANHSHNLSAPDFDSGWFTMQSQQGTDSYKEVTHDLGQYPSRVKVLVKAIDGANEGFIFEAIGVASKDDDEDNRHYGGVVFAYNQTTVRLWAPDKNNGEASGHIIFIADGWGGEVNRQFSESAEVKVLVWR